MARLRSVGWEYSPAPRDHGQLSLGEGQNDKTCWKGVLTGPRRSMSSCLIWDTRASLATRALCKRSLNSISSPCISATCNTQTHTMRLRGRPDPITCHPTSSGLCSHATCQQGITRWPGLTTVTLLSFELFKSTRKQIYLDLLGFNTLESKISSLWPDSDRIRSSLNPGFYYQS